MLTLTVCSLGCNKSSLKVKGLDETHQRNEKLKNLIQEDQ